MDYKQERKISYIDLHQDLITHLRAGSPSQTDIKSIKKYIKLFWGAIFIDPNQKMKKLDQIHTLIKRDIKWYNNLDKRYRFFKTIKKPSDISELKNKCGVIIHLEGADALTPKTEQFIDEWHELGLNSIGFTWNLDNAIGTSAASNRPRQGLTSFGKKIIKKFNRLGIIIDCAHLNQAGFYDILKISQKPPLVSHGNAYAICPNPRNFTDKQIKDLKRVGGIIGVFFSAKYIRSDRRPTIHDAVRHIIHLVEVGGIESVAIGSDFGGITSGLIPRLNRVSQIDNLTRALRLNGFSRQEIEKILYLNVLNYLKKIF